MGIPNKISVEEAVLSDVISQPNVAALASGVVAIGREGLLFGETIRTKYICMTSRIFSK